MKTYNLDYFLPEELVAQKSVLPRDHSRLMVLDRETKKVEHSYFYNIFKYLRPNDILVLNNTKVIPARLWGKTRINTDINADQRGLGRKIEVLLLKVVNSNTWECLLGSKKRKVGLTINFGNGLKSKITEKLENGIWKVRFNLTGKKLKEKIYKLGEMPTPPYIKVSKVSKVAKDYYQTVYAKHEGSVAAPTAGFHFTKELIKKLKKLGVQFEFITLHVGLGTFLPIKTENIKDHRIHKEYAVLTKKVADRLNQAKKEGRRIIAVGTTSTRVLEAAAIDSHLKPIQNWIDLFIYPGYKFKFVDGLITNFHLPKSTLLALVYAFGGENFIRKAYRQAIKKRYRFYSFGDVMLIF